MNKCNINTVQLKSWLCVILVLLQVTVIFGSWVWSAAMPESPVKSLLSNSGIRWLFGTFVANLSSPLLIWIVLLDIAGCMCVRSGLWSSIGILFYNRRKSLDAQRRSGLKACLGLFCIEVAVILLLTVVPHAILLSVTGELFPSSFSVSIIPIIAFMGVTLSICYGLFSGTLHNYKDVANCAYGGGKNLKFIIVIYVLAVELYYSVIYVLG